MYFTTCLNVGLIPTYSRWRYYLEGLKLAIPLTTLTAVGCPVGLEEKYLFMICSQFSVLYATLSTSSWCKYRCEVRTCIEVHTYHYSRVLVKNRVPEGPRSGLFQTRPIFSSHCRGGVVVPSGRCL